MKIVLIQQEIQFSNPEYNITKAVALIKAVHTLESQNDPAHPVDLIVLPEFLQGSPHQPDHKHYVDLDEKQLDLFCSVAKELNVCLVPGTISHYTNTPGKTLLNTAYFISKQGKVNGLYNKRNLWHTERASYTKGSEPHTVFQTELGLAGMLVCWDVMFSEAFKQLAAQDVDLIVVPSFWTADDIELPSNCDIKPVEMPRDTETKFLKTAITTRAYESGALVVYTNVGGAPSKGYIGCSQVALPLWGVLPATRVYDFPGLYNNSTVVDAPTVTAAAFIKHAKVTPGPVDGILDTSEESLDRVMVVQFGDSNDTLEKRLRLAEDMYKIRQDLKSKDWNYAIRDL